MNTLSPDFNRINFFLKIDTLKQERREIICIVFVKREFNYRNNMSSKSKKTREMTRLRYAI